MTDNTPNEQVVANEAASEPMSISDELRAGFESFNTEEAPEVKETEAAKEEASPETEETATESPEENPEIDIESELPLIPKDWSAQEKEQFEAIINSDNEELAVAAQVLINRYESMKKGLNSKFQEVATQRKEYKAVDEVLAPYQEKFQEMKLSKAEYLNHLINVDKRLSSDPVSTVRDMIKAYKLTPQQLGIQTDEFDFDIDDLTSDKKPANNETEQLKAEVQNLKNQVELEPYKAQIRQFSEAKDTQGKLKHPHFQEATTTMRALIEADPKLTLEQAYTKALKVLDLEPQIENSSNVDEIRKKIKADKAKLASRGINSNAGRVDYAKLSIEDELRAKFTKGIN